MRVRARARDDDDYRSEVFATFAIFSISRDFSATRHSAEERWEQSPCLSHSSFPTLRFRPVYYYIRITTLYRRKSSDLCERLSGSLPRKLLLFRESAVHSFTRDNNISVINGPSLCAPRCRATKRGKCVLAISVTATSARLPVRSRRWFTSCEIARSKCEYCAVAYFDFGVALFNGQRSSMQHCDFFTFFLFIFLNFARFAPKPRCEMRLARSISLNRTRLPKREENGKRVAAREDNLSCRSQ